MSLFRRLSVLMAVFLLFASPGWAQAGERDVGAEARTHFQAGQRAYEAGKFKEALDEFTAAYELKPHPLLLFNMGQCQRHLKNYEKAIFLLEGYLREDPKTPHKKLVEQLLQESREGLAEERARPPDLESLEARLVEELARREQEIADRLAALEAATKTAKADGERAQVEERLAEIAARDAEIAQLRDQLANVRAKESTTEEADLEARKKALEAEEARAQQRQAELERIAKELEALRLQNEAEESSGMAPIVVAGVIGGGALVAVAAVAAGAAAAGYAGAAFLFPAPTAGVVDLGAPQ